MSKYIDADKLIAKIVELRKELPNTIEHLNDEESGFARGQQYELTAIEAEILCLQQEQPEVQSGKFIFPKYLYARTKDNKTIDLSYAPQDMTAIEYIRNDSIEQEHPDVDLEKLLNLELPDMTIDEDLGLCTCNHFGNQSMTVGDIKEIARHFYELGLNARKEGQK